jgi:flagellar biosynthesis GTPase FlhF
MGAFEKELKSMDGAWSSAPESGDLPVGQYTMQLGSVEIRKTQADKMRAFIHYVVTEGTHQGVGQNDGFTLDTENPDKGMSMFKQWMKNFVDEIPETMLEVKEILAELSNTNPLLVADVVKSKDGQYTNVRVVEVLGSADDADGVVEEEEEEEEEELSVGDEVEFTNPEDGEEYTGTIMKVMKNDMYKVETEDDVITVSGDILRGEAEEEEEEAEEEEEEAEEEEEEAEEEEEEAEEEEEEEAEEEEEEAEEEEEEAEEEEEEAEEEVTEEQLFELASAHDLEVDDEMNGAQLVAAIKKHKWYRSELTDEEIEIVELCDAKILDKGDDKKAGKNVAKVAPKKVGKVAKKVGKEAPKKKVAAKVAPKKKVGKITKKVSRK